MLITVHVGKELDQTKPGIAIDKIDNSLIELRNPEYPAVIHKLTKRPQLRKHLKDSLKKYKTLWIHNWNGEGNESYDIDNLDWLVNELIETFRLNWIILPTQRN